MSGDGYHEHYFIVIFISLITNQIIFTFFDKILLNYVAIKEISYLILAGMMIVGVVG